MSAPLLRVEDLTVRFSTGEGSIVAVDRVSFEIETGRALALVGESGSGKSATAHALLRLLPEATSDISAEVLRIEEQDVLAASEGALRRLRGGRVGMVFQEPLSSLNPVYRVGAQIIEAIRLHQPLSRRMARERALALCERVGLPNPKERLDAYPHELSGGMRQRVMLAIALANDPALLIADEPTTALDMTVQAQFLARLAELREQTQMGLLFITHDLSLVLEVADEVAVMYAGQIVERGPVEAVLDDPKHPYTRALLASVLPASPEPRPRTGFRPDRLPTLPGGPPPPGDLPKGCRFRDRCPSAFEACIDPPSMYAVDHQRVRCFLFRTEEEATE